jgi:glycerol uptake facilitator-like aquaporin
MLSIAPWRRLLAELVGTALLVTAVVGTGIRGTELAGYAVAQTLGAIGGSVLANLMFGLAPVTFSTTERAAGHLWLGEVVATAGLLLLIFALGRSGRASAAPAAVGAYIGAAYWFTSSTSFANPAVTIGRAFTRTFAGIAPGSVAGFVAFQLVGLLVGVGLLLALYPDAGRTADDIVVEHPLREV